MITSGQIYDNQTIRTLLNRLAVEIDYRENGTDSWDETFCDLTTEELEMLEKLLGYCGLVAQQNEQKLFYLRMKGWFYYG